MVDQRVKTTAEPQAGRAWTRYALRLFEFTLAAAALAYALVFAWNQTGGFLDPHVMEWDARTMVLSIWRYHGSGLFPKSLAVDFAGAMCPLGWKLLYWLGTLFTTPVTISKLVPFLCLGIVVWQGFQFGRRFGGIILGAAVVVLLVHCNQLWDRMVGGNPRAGLAQPYR